MIPAWHAVNTAWGPLSFIESVESWEAGVDARDESDERKAKRRAMIRIVEGDVPAMLERRYLEMVECHELSLQDETKKQLFEFAFDKFQGAMQYCSKEVLALHAEECGCDWSPDNADIFHLTPREPNVEAE